MLLEYTLETKEDELKDKAILLRARFAERRLKSGLDNGIINANHLLQFKESNRNEILQHQREIHDITNAKCGNQLAVARAEQQLEIQKGLRALDRDVSRAARLGKARIDTLSDLENRIGKLRYILSHPSHSETVDGALDAELRTNNHSVLERHFTVCKRCSRRVLSKLIDAHSNACKKINGSIQDGDVRPAVYDANISPSITLATFPPQPPRLCKLAGKGSNYLEFSWEPPIIDGGLPIFEYEISYKLVTKIFDLSVKAWRRKIEGQPIVKTSWWAMMQPINHYGFRLLGLKADTEYEDLQVRCCNLKGYSDWVSLLSGDSPFASRSVTTDPAKPASKPLHFMWERVTSSCLHLSWRPPLFDGGLHITSYLIFYTVVRREKSVSGAIRLIEKQEILNTKSVQTSFVIRNLPSSSILKNVYVRAFTTLDFENLNADSKPLESGLETKEPSRYRKFAEEIKRAEGFNEDYFDTDFETGVLQRLDRKQYIRRLKRKIAKIQADPEEEEERLVWEGILAEKLKRDKDEDEKYQLSLVDFNDDIDPDEEGTTGDLASRRSAAEASVNELDNLQSKKSTGPLDPFSFPMRVRDKHYRLCISKLERLIKALNEELFDVELDRNRLTILMQRESKKLMDLQLEKDRLKNFKGESISSAVLHGALMRYDVETFTRDVQQAWEDCLGTIASSKRKMIDGESRKKDIKVELVHRDEQLKDRQAAYKRFTFERDKAKRAVERLRGSNEQTIQRMFDRLREATSAQKQLRARVIDMFAEVKLRHQSAAFSKWSKGFFGNEAGDTSNYIGIGSLLLQKARKEREDVQSELRDIINSTASLKRDMQLVEISRNQRRKLMQSSFLPQMPEGMDYSKLNFQGMRFLFEADGLATINKFGRAFELYEAQIITLRSQPNTNVKLLALCYGRLGKLFIREEKWDRAIVEFDRQMSLAREVSDQVEEADAYFGLGSGYLGRCDYADAIRYLELAQIRFEMLGHTPNSVLSMKALRECYARMQRIDLVDIYSKRIEVSEREHHLKAETMYKTLDELKERLVVTSAEEEMMINIERITYRTVELRHLIDLKYTDRSARQDELEAQKKTVLQLSGLLEAIQKELMEAVECDDDVMISYLVHDIPQEVEIEELKKKLRERKLIEQQNFTQAKFQQTKLETMIANIENDIETAKEDLTLESGELMKAVKGRRPYRCMALNPANAAGNEVTGTASGGVENFVAAESCNVHLIDMHLGTVLHIWPGDDDTRVGDKMGHTAVVTCVIYDALRVYSGSADELIMVWDATSFERVLVLEGHEGSIVSMAIDGPLLMSGSADATVRMWDKLSGKLFKIIVGHSLSVLSLELGPTWMVTGSADEEVRLWSITQRTERSYSVETTLRLSGHEAPVTCVRYGKLEIVSGDNLGRVLVWWLATGKVLRKCEIHKGPVRSLQFDATRIVSGGVDSKVCITDIGSGVVLQSLRGHTAPVLAVAFDTERIVSVSVDNTLRYWIWGKKIGPQDKYHVLDSGQTLSDVCKIYKILITDLMQWNGISDMRKVFPGMRLLVAKGDSNVSTVAEKHLMEISKKRDTGNKYADRKLAEAMGDQLYAYSRVQKIADDQNGLTTIGNRMFKNEKLADDVFPDTIDVTVDAFALKARIANGGVPPEHRKRVPMVIAAANEEDWGNIADDLGRAMIDIFVEFQAYEIAKELKAAIRDPKTLVGRITQYTMLNGQTTGMRPGSQGNPGGAPNLSHSVKQSSAPGSAREDDADGINPHDTSPAAIMEDNITEANLSAVNIGPKRAARHIRSRASESSKMTSVPLESSGGTDLSHTQPDDFRHPAGDPLPLVIGGGNVPFPEPIVGDPASEEHAAAGSPKEKDRRRHRHRSGKKKHMGNSASRRQADEESLPITSLESENN